MDKEDYIEIYIQGYKRGQKEAWKEVQNLISHHDGWELKSRVESKIGTLYQDVKAKRAEVKKDPDFMESIEVLEKESSKDQEKEEEQKKDQKTEKRKGIDWNPGDSCIIMEERPSRGFKEFSRLLKEGVPGLFISRASPDKAVDKYQIPKENCEFIWLSKGGSDSPKIEGMDGRKVSPSNLSALSSVIGSFEKEKGECVVFISGLSSMTNFSERKKIFNFLSWARDRVAGRGSSGQRGFFLLSVSSKAVKDKFLEKIKAEFDEVVDA